jgi:hypothetical protein
MKAATLVQKRYVEPFANGASIVERTPILLGPSEVNLTITGGKLNLMFPMSVYGVESTDRIVALYRRSDGLPEGFDVLSDLELSVDPKNLWTQLRHLVTVDSDGRGLTGFPLDLMRTPVRILTGSPDRNTELRLAVRVARIDGLLPERRADVVGVFSTELADNLYPSEEPARVAWQGSDLRLCLVDALEQRLGQVPTPIRVELANPFETRDRSTGYSVTFTDDIPASAVQYRIRAVRN